MESHRALIIQCNYIQLSWYSLALSSKHDRSNLRNNHSNRAEDQSIVLKGHYPTQVSVSDEQIATLKLTQRKICPQWNYVIHARHLTSC